MGFMCKSSQGELPRHCLGCAPCSVPWHTLLDGNALARQHTLLEWGTLHSILAHIAGRLSLCCLYLSDKQTSLTDISNKSPTSTPQPHLQGCLVVTSTQTVSCDNQSYLPIQCVINQHRADALVHYLMMYMRWRADLVLEPSMVHGVVTHLNMEMGTQLLYVVPLKICDNHVISALL